MSLKFLYIAGKTNIYMDGSLRIFNFEHNQLLKLYFKNKYIWKSFRITRVHNSIITHSNAKALNFY